MVPQYENKVLSSFFLWVEHTLLSKGEAFTNHGSKFYPVNNRFNGYYTYAAPFKGFVFDSSVSAATVPTGIYLNNLFITKGQSGLHDINYEQGQVYFSGALSSTDAVSGNFAVKDFNIRLTDTPEERLLFETKFEIKPKVLNTVTGLAPDAVTYPVIYLKNNGGTNEAFAFGGMDKSKMSVRAIVLADSQFNLDAVCSIFKDRNLTTIGLVEAHEMPFNHFGGFRSGVFNYNNLLSGRINPHNSVFLNSVHVSRFNVNTELLNEIKRVNPNIYPAFIDFELESYRFPRI